MLINAFNRVIFTYHNLIARGNFRNFSSAQLTVLDVRRSASTNT